MQWLRDHQGLCLSQVKPRDPGQEPSSVLLRWLLCPQSHAASVGERGSREGMCFQSGDWEFVNLFPSQNRQGLSHFPGGKMWPLAERPCVSEEGDTFERIELKK